MAAKIGQIYEQIKVLDGFPYNSVGSKWFVKDLQGKYIVLKCGSVGLGVNDEELKEHFKIFYDEINHNDDYVNDDEDEGEVYDGEETANNIEEELKTSKFKSFLRRIGLRN